MPLSDQWAATRPLQRSPSAAAMPPYPRSSRRLWLLRQAHSEWSLGSIPRGRRLIGRALLMGQAPSNFDVFHGTETDLRSATYGAGARGARKKRPVSTDTLGTEIKPTPSRTGCRCGMLSMFWRDSAAWPVRRWFKVEIRYEYSSNAGLGCEADDGPSAVDDRRRDPAYPHRCLVVARRHAGRRFCRRIPGEHLIGQRKTLRRDDQCNHHLHAVGPVITRVAELALALILQRRVDLKVGGCEVVHYSPTAPL